MRQTLPRRYQVSSHCAQIGMGLIVLLGAIAGCQRAATAPLTAETPAAASESGQTTAPSAATNSAPARTYAPVQLGGSSSHMNSTGVTAADARSESVLEELQPLQVMLGKWSGNARKAAALHEVEWVWDFQSQPEQPALVMSAPKSSYITSARLTYDPATSKFQMSMQTPEGVERQLQGTYSQPVEDVAGDDKKLQRTFKLELQEATSDSANEQWQVAFHQLENNRYLIELDRRRGAGAFQRVDTVHSQRDGTSFALSDSDYGEKTCIISQGLGTISVSHNGRSFWVCCSGCQAAFNDDPEKWIAKWEVKQKEMMK